MQVLVWTTAECPKRFLMEVKSMFPDLDPETVLIVPTSQKSVLDLASFGEDVDKEKDELLEKVGKHYFLRPWISTGAGEQQESSCLR